MWTPGRKWPRDRWWGGCKGKSWRWEQLRTQGGRRGGRNHQRGAERGQCPALTPLIGLAGCSGRGSHASVAGIRPASLNSLTPSGPTESRSKTENRSSSWSSDSRRGAGTGPVATATPVGQSSGVTAGAGGPRYNLLSAPLFRRAKRSRWAVERRWVPPWHPHRACAHLPRPPPAAPTGTQAPVAANRTPPPPATPLRLERAHFSATSDALCPVRPRKRPLAPRVSFVASPCAGPTVSPWAWGTQGKHADFRAAGLVVGGGRRSLGRENVLLLSSIRGGKRQTRGCWGDAPANWATRPGRSWLPSW